VYSNTLSREHGKWYVCIPHLAGAIGCQNIDICIFWYPILRSWRMIRMHPSSRRCVGCQNTDTYYIYIFWYPILRSWQIICMHPSSCRCVNIFFQSYIAELSMEQFLISYSLSQLLKYRRVSEYRFAIMANYLWNALTPCTHIAVQYTLYNIYRVVYNTL